MKKLLPTIPLALATLVLAPQHAIAADAIQGPVSARPLNLSAIAMFFVFVLLTLGITRWAAKRTRSAA